MKYQIVKHHLMKYQTPTKLFYKNQNWAKLTPALAVVSALLLFLFFRPTQVMFWALINIPLYFLHQTEEHLWPGGFKKYVNQVINKLPPGEEMRTNNNF